MSDDKSQPFYAAWWFEWLFIGLCFAAGWFLWDNVTRHWVENAPLSNRFLDLARSLASGHGFTLTQGGARLPYLETPPLYPALLALVMRGVGATGGIALFEAFLALNLSLYLLSIALAYAFLRRRIKKPYCFYITALYAISPLTLSAAQSMTPAMTYLICSLAALLAIDHYFADRRPTVGRWPLVWTCVCVIASLAAKNLGLSLLGAFIWMAFTKLPFRQASVAVAVIALVMTPWITRDILYRNAGIAAPQAPIADVEGRMALTSPFRSQARFGRQLWKNADALSADLTDALLGTVNFHRMGAPIAREAGLSRWTFRYADVGPIRWLLGLLVLTGLSIGLYQLSGVGGLYLLLFLATTLCLPLESSLSLFPVFPLALFYLYTGVLWVAHGVEKVFQTRIANIAFPALTALIALNSADGHLGAVAAATSGDETVAMLATQEQVQENRYQRAIRWLQANTSSDARLAAVNAEAIERRSGRRARPPLETDSVREMAAQLLRRADYVVEDQDHPDARATLTPALQAYPSHFRLAFNDPAARIRIWQTLNPS